MNTLLLPLAALLISILLVVVFFCKKNIGNKETKLYSLMLVVNLIFAFLAVFIYLFAKTVGLVFVIGLSQKIYMICLLMLIVLIFLYNLFISDLSVNVKRGFSYFSIGLGSIFSIASLFSPIEVINYGDVIDGIGLSHDIIYVSAVVYLVFIVVCCIYNMFKNKNNFTKAIPFIVLIILYVVGLVARIYYPYVLFENFFFSFMLLVMYFTIENPDVKMIEKLEKAKAFAEKSDAAKTEFLNNISREIRIPLNSIVGLTEDIISYRKYIPDEVVEDARDIKKSSESLIEVVDNIMNINKNHSTDLTLVEDTYSFRDEIVKVTKAVAARIIGKPIKFNIDLSDDIPYLLIGDANHIKQIISNLLSNAVKYTDEGTIDFIVKCINQGSNCNLMVKVIDTGRGINVKTVNDYLEKVDSDELSATKETGLGLAITKALVEMMGGKLEIQSELGKGSTFSVYIPQKIKKMNKPNKVTVFESERFNDLNYGHRRVLIVDDTFLNVKVVSKILTGLGFEIDTVDDGEKCLDKINSGFIYDLILMDIMMPQLSGIDTFKELKKIDGFDIPVIALTADCNEAARERYISLGFTDYLAKPFTREQIIEKLILIFDDDVNTSKNVHDKNGFDDSSSFFINNNSNANTDKFEFNENSDIEIEML